VGGAAGELEAAHRGLVAARRRGQHARAERGGRLRGHASSLGSVQVNRVRPLSRSSATIDAEVWPSTSGPLTSIASSAVGCGDD
jgi:hypothetical protein